MSGIATTFLDVLRWLILWGGVVHFKVGLWRACGYRMDPYFNRPWMATNLVNFWGRFTFHYREFLSRAFYYPVFFAFFKKHLRLRIFASTMAAAAFGNLVWGHATERLFYRGMQWGELLDVLRRWPYFAALGLAISATELFLLWKSKRRRHKKRKAWTLDRFIWVDVLSAYATIQFYGLITIFARPAPDSTQWGLLRLVLIGLGVHE